VIRYIISFVYYLNNYYIDYIFIYFVDLIIY